MCAALRGIPPPECWGIALVKGSRLDERVVAEGLCETRSQARSLIMTGRVLVDDVAIDKPGTRVRDESTLRLKGGLQRYVSRGGEKLSGALEDLAFDPSGLACLDVGASTGGFTDCLLQAGAREVVALDVGYGQLHSRLRSDPRVIVREKSNARLLDASWLPGPIDLIVVDASFISLRLLLPVFAEQLPEAQIIALVKPQFEVGKDKVGKGGVVRDDELRMEAVAQVRDAATAVGYRASGQVESRLAGPKGNREVFLWLRRGVRGEFSLD
jgi:23S rRNA (cytidine1920-2'-O)/16S rRNA (cytidine1409-2'-O)-methyltransferase